MDYSHLMVMLSALLIGNSLFFSGYFLFGTSKSARLRTSGRLLALLLLAFAMRISKSVIYILFPQYGDTLTVIGIVGMLAIGPLVWFYIRSKIRKTKIGLYHFLPAAFLIASIPWLTGQGIYFAYLVSLVHLLGYFVFAIKLYQERITGEIILQKARKEWSLQLLLAIAVIWVGFLIQAFTTDKELYIGVTLGIVLVFFGISFSAMLNYKGVIQPFALNNDATVDLNSVAEKASLILLKEKLYLKNDFTLGVFAKSVGVRRHVLSNAINAGLKQSFPELLNSVRIEHSKTMLADEKCKDISIEAIAFESGFNSLSVFYNNFKKYNGVTPAEFREKVVQSA